MRFRPVNASERMEAACKRLFEATQDIGVWEWDDTYVAALAIIESPHEGEALAALTELLPYSWNTLEIKSAPETVRRISDVWRDLMAGQLLFVLDPEADPMLFATLWPWGDRLKSSLRVSCTAVSSAVVRADPQARLRACFNL